MKSITYSFIIPHHNTPDLLNRCLDSIPKRDDIQIIVVDDNSSENKRPHVKRDDVKVLYIDAANTKGAGRARNYGLKEAQGKWLLFADADDYYTKEFISVLDEYAKDDFDVLYFEFMMVDHAGKELQNAHSSARLISLLDNTQTTIDALKFRNNVPWNKMYNRCFIANNGINFEETVNGNDILFSVLVGHFSKKIKIEKKPLYNYVQTAQSLTTRKQNIDEIFCRFRHTLQKNAYNTSIGYSGWNEHFMHRVGRMINYLRKSKHYFLIIKLLLALVIRFPGLIAHRNDYIKTIILLEKKS